MSTDPFAVSGFNTTRIAYIDPDTEQFKSLCIPYNEECNLMFYLPSNRVRGIDISFLHYDRIVSFLNLCNVKPDSRGYYLRNRSALAKYLNEHDYISKYKIISKDMIEKFIDDVKNSN